MCLLFRGTFYAVSSWVITVSSDDKILFNHPSVGLNLAKMWFQARDDSSLCVSTLHNTTFIYTTSVWFRTARYSLERYGTIQQVQPFTPCEFSAVTKRGDQHGDKWSSCWLLCCSFFYNTVNCLAFPKALCLDGYELVNMRKLSEGTRSASVPTVEA